MSFIMFLWLAIIVVLFFCVNRVVTEPTTKQVCTIILSTALVMWAIQFFQSAGAFGPIRLG